jgi:transposase
MSKKGRKPQSEKLSRHQMFAYLTKEEKVGSIDTYFIKDREERDIIPAQVRVLEYMQEKATFKLKTVAALSKSPS